jgi:FkbM family methyltransferase
VAVERLIRVARRFATSGQLSSCPIPIIRRILKDQAFFVQVGSNDGLTGDPLHELIMHNPLWKGIFIEPVDYVFERLIRNYGNRERFAFEQIAIAEEAGEREFFYVSEQALQDPAAPSFSDQLGSFDRSHITNHSLLLDKYIISKKIRCELLESVLNKHNVVNIDIIHIDAEGYDYKVLRQINFDRYKPRLVLFEHSHLRSGEIYESWKLLKSHGYKLINCGLDTLAITR